MKLKKIGMHPLIYFAIILSRHHINLIYLINLIPAFKNQINDYELKLALEMAIYHKEIYRKFL